MVASPYEYTKRSQYIHFEWVNYILWELYINRDIKKNQSLPNLYSRGWEQTIAASFKICLIVFNCSWMRGNHHFQSWRSIIYMNLPWLNDSVAFLLHEHFSCCDRHQGLAHHHCHSECLNWPQDIMIMGLRQNTGAMKKGKSRATTSNCFFSHWISMFLKLYEILIVTYLFHPKSLKLWTCFSFSSHLPVLIFQASYVSSF